ncbi:MAG: hypothetical protein KJ607_14660, partial [Bacteroidetes bacterium]|nr:hypothetical protein [Bacteroidota bacterium]
MLGYIILILSVLFSALTFAQTGESTYSDGNVKCRGEYIEYTYLRTQPGTIKLDKTKCKKKGGEWTCWYPNGSMMRIEHYDNSKKGY